MKKIFLCIFVSLIAGVVMADEGQSKSAGAVQETYEVRLVDGTVLSVRNHRFQTDFVVFRLGDGSTLAFRREDVQLETLPSRSTRRSDPEDRVDRRERTQGPQRPDAVGDRRLNDVASKTHLSDDEVFIVGDGTLTEVSPASSFEEQRQEAIPQSEDMPAPELVIKDAGSVAGLTCKGYEQSLAGPSPIYTNMQCQVIAKAYVEYGKIRPPKDHEVGPGTIIVSIRISEFGHSISSDVQILRLGPNGYLPPEVVDSFSIPGVTGSNSEDDIRFWVRMWETIDKKYLR